MKFLKNTYFEGHLRTAASVVLLIIKLAKYRVSVLNQKHNVEWFLLRLLVDLVFTNY